MIRCGIRNMGYPDHNPYLITGNPAEDHIPCCCHDIKMRGRGAGYGGHCSNPAVWFYVLKDDRDVFFRCREHRYPVSNDDNEEGPGPWVEMTREEIAKEWEVEQVMEL